MIRMFIKDDTSDRCDIMLLENMNNDVSLSVAKIRKTLKQQQVLLL